MFLYNRIRQCLRWSYWAPDVLSSITLLVNSSIFPYSCSFVSEDHWIRNFHILIVSLTAIPTVLLALLLASFWLVYNSPVRTRYFLTITSPMILGFFVVVVCQFTPFSCLVCQSVNYFLSLVYGSLNTIHWYICKEISISYMHQRFSLPDWLHLM